MNILIDTNIVLDVLLRREPYYENAAKIIVLSEKGYLRCYISASAITDIFYIVREELGDKDAAVGLLKSILQTTRVADVTESGIHTALHLNWSDFEDSVQYVAGQSIPADFIITRNMSDFSESRIEIATPERFLEKILV